MAFLADEKTAGASSRNTAGLVVAGIYLVVLVASLIDEVPYALQYLGSGSDTTPVLRLLFFVQISNAVGALLFISWAWTGRLKVGVAAVGMNAIFPLFDLVFAIQASSEFDDSLTNYLAVFLPFDPRFQWALDAGLVHYLVQPYFLLLMVWLVWRSWKNSGRSPQGRDEASTNSEPREPAGPAEPIVKSADRKDGMDFYKRIINLEPHQALNSLWLIAIFNLVVGALIWLINTVRMAELRGDFYMDALSWQSTGSQLMGFGVLVVVVSLAATAIVGATLNAGRANEGE